MRKVWKYNIHQLGSKSQISGFSALLTAVVILILYSAELSLPLLTPLPAFAENSQGISARNVNLQSIKSSSSEIIATNNIAANTNAAHIKSAAANSSGTVIEKMSDKAMYKVQLRSNGPFNFLPKNGFDMQILFLNANASEPSATSIAREQQQQQQPTPVNSFDITIYSNKGKVLWQKTNQTITAATAFEKVAFTNGGGYNGGGGGGGITIQITNIKPSPIPLGTAMPLFSQNSSNGTRSILGSTGNNNNKTSTDSVTFTAAVAK
jgi:hypothetical protein